MFSAEVEQICTKDDVSLWHSWSEVKPKSPANHRAGFASILSEVMSKDCRHSVSHQLSERDISQIYPAKSLRWHISEAAAHVILKKKQTKHRKGRVPSLCHVSGLVSGLGICCEAQWYHEESLPAPQWPYCQGGGGISQLGFRCCEKVEVWMDNERRRLLSTANVFLKVYTCSLVQELRVRARCFKCLAWKLNFSWRIALKVGIPRRRLQMCYDLEIGKLSNIF